MSTLPKSGCKIAHSKRKPCPSCETGTKGCSTRTDKSVFCRGDMVNPAMWTDLLKGKRDKHGFLHLRSVDDTTNLNRGHGPRRDATAKPRRERKQYPIEEAKEGKPQNWHEAAKQFREKMRTADFAAMARNLELPAGIFDAFVDKVRLPLVGLSYTPYAICDETLGKKRWVGSLIMPMADGLLMCCGIQKRLDERLVIDERGKVVPITAGNEHEATNKRTMKGSTSGIYLGSEYLKQPGMAVFVEGGSDVIILGLCGIPAFGRPSNVCGAEIAAEQLADHPEVEPVVLGENDQRYDELYECEKWPGKEGVDAVAPELAARLGRPVRTAYPPPEYKDVRCWFKGLLEGQGNSIDLAAIAAEIRRHIEETAVVVEPRANLEDFDEPAQPDEPPAAESLTDPLPIHYFADVKPALDAADFVEGLLIADAMSVVYGDSGSGKSFFALDLALHVAGKLSWRGRAVDQMGVLYLVLEGSHGFTNRLAAFKSTSNVADLPFAYVPVALNLLNPDADAGRVIEAAKAAAARMKTPVGLIVVDTLSRALAGGNENSPEDMTGFIGNVDRIRQALPAHTMIIHHSGKDAARGARGHGSLRAATDTEIEVTRSGSPNVSVASVKKQRDLEAGAEFAFRMEQVTLGIDRRGKPITTCVVRVADVPTREAGLTKDEQTAITVLFDLITADGKIGFPGVPEGVSSVPLEWWRDRFYKNARPGDKQDTKKRAFQRAREGLIASNRVKAHEERVWMPTRPMTLADLD